MFLSMNPKIAEASSPLVATTFVLGLLLLASSASAQTSESVEKASPDQASPDQADPDQVDPDQPSQDAKKSSVNRSQALAATISQAHGPNGYLKREWRWDASVDIGYGKAWESVDPWGLMAGGRLGATWVTQPHYLTAGATVYWSQQLDPTAGLQVEYLSDATAMWLQTGAFSEFDGDLGAMAALGWQLFAVEAQVRNRPGDQPAHWALFGKLRVPVSWFFYIPK
jgi:hypothetical protein